MYQHTMYFSTMYRYVHVRAAALVADIDLHTYHLPLTLLIWYPSHALMTCIIATMVLSVLHVYHGPMV